MLSNRDLVLHREVGREYPVAERAEGAYIYDAAGRRYLDAAGSYFTMSIGHGVPEVVEAIKDHVAKLDFAHTGFFTTAVAQQFAARLIALAPAGFAKVYFTTSGSASNEAAIKLARQYHLLNGKSQKSKVIARWHGYHGASLGALSLTGHVRRREPFEPLLLPFPHIDPAYCYRCPFGKQPADCAVDCADQLERTIQLIGPQYISAFILEPVAGGPLGAAVPHDAYLPRIREICDRHDVLMIADEVITGAGRTGAPLAVRHWDVTPDIVTLAKGIGGGFAPIGALLVHERIWGKFEAAGMSFRHGETFSGHPLVCAIGNAVLGHIERQGLIERARDMGERLGAALEPLRELAIVGDVRGKGLLRGIEFVADKRTRRPFPRRLAVAERIAKALTERGVLVVPGTGCADGIDGDTIALAPPFTIGSPEIDMIVTALTQSITEVAASLHKEAAA
jgi:adenosylmethionine-8-amino-7-oxononanoate aminotransferase